MWRLTLSALLGIGGLMLLFIGSFDDPASTLRDLPSAFGGARAPMLQSAVAATSPGQPRAEPAVPAADAQLLAQPIDPGPSPPLLGEASPSASVEARDGIVEENTSGRTGADLGSAASQVPAVPAQPPNAAASAADAGAVRYAPPHQAHLTPARRPPAPNVSASPAGFGTVSLRDAKTLRASPRNRVYHQPVIAWDTAIQGGQR
jgi:hypothetical protein